MYPIDETIGLARALFHRLAHLLGIWPAEVFVDDDGWGLKCCGCGAVERYSEGE